MESEEALKTYIAHDVHEEFKTLFKPYVAGQLSPLLLRLSTERGCRQLTILPPADVLAYDMEI